jgi:putative membrane protein
MKITNVVGALALALFPFSALAADNPPAAGAPEEGPPPGEILTKLHHSNQAEIEAGKLAQEKGVSKEVKDYGKVLVKDHTAADKQVTALAKQLKVEFETIPEMKNAKLEMAKTITGPEFDRTFAQAMLEDHARDVSEASAARDTTKNPKLKKLLTALVPKLEKHRDLAQKIADKPAGADTAATGAPGMAPGTGASAGSPPPAKPAKP